MNAKLSPDDMAVSFRVMGCLVPASTEQPVLLFILLILYHIGNIMSSSYSQFHEFFWWNICL